MVDVKALMRVLERRYGVAALRKLTDKGSRERGLARVLPTCDAEKGWIHMCCRSGPLRGIARQRPPTHPLGTRVYSPVAVTSSSDDRCSRPCAASILTAQYLYSGILPIGSSWGLVRTFAAAST